MTWAAPICLAGRLGPLPAMAGDVIGYVVTAASEAVPSLTASDIIQFGISAVNLGVLGIVFWLFIKGHLHNDSEVERLREEIARIGADKAKVEDQLAEERRLVRDLVPILATFNTTTATLLPILQAVVQREETIARRPRGGGR